MAGSIELSERQRSVLEAIANHSGYGRTLRGRARAVLAAADGQDVIRISQQVRLDEGSVRSALAAWNAAAKDIAATEHFGRDLLHRKVELALTEVDQPGGCCDCENEADDAGLSDLSNLAADDIRQIAQRVYALLRHELRVERERLYN